MNNNCTGYTPGDVELYFLTDGIDTSLFSKRHKKADNAGHITGHVAADWHKSKNKSVHPYSVFYKGDWAGDPEIDIDDPNPNPPPPSTPPSPSAK
jgi:hypothetical protein